MYGQSWMRLEMVAEPLSIQDYDVMTATVEQGLRQLGPDIPATSCNKNFHFFAFLVFAETGPSDYDLGDRHKFFGGNRAVIASPLGHCGRADTSGERDHSGRHAKAGSETAQCKVRVATPDRVDDTCT